jgi:hypothetical protein
MMRLRVTPIDFNCEDCPHLLEEWETRKGVCIYPSRWEDVKYGGKKAESERPIGDIEGRPEWCPLRGLRVGSEEK